MLEVITSIKEAAKIKRVIEAQQQKDKTRKKCVNARIKTHSGIRK